MYEAFIKEWLLKNQSRVYSVIVKTYRQKLDDLQPTLFRKWLAKEIAVSEEKINLSSLNSALMRSRKREEKARLKGKNNNAAFHAAQNPDKKDDFIFSSADNISYKKRTTEL
jgi:hypothetical protein